MPDGYVKLVCDDCGGKLLVSDDWMPRFCICSQERLGDAEMVRIAEAFESMAPDTVPILDRGIEIKAVKEEVLRCESCGALYERASNDK